MYNAIDYNTRCVVTLYPKQDDCKPFDVVVYGRHKDELLTVPNDVVQVLCARYPDYFSSPFDVY